MRVGAAEGLQPGRAPTRARAGTRERLYEHESESSSGEEETSTDESGAGTDEAGDRSHDAGTARCRRALGGGQVAAGSGSFAASTTQHNTTQHNTTQHNTTQHTLSSHSFKSTRQTAARSASAAAASFATAGEEEYCLCVRLVGQRRTSAPFRRRVIRRRAAGHSQAIRSTNRAIVSTNSITRRTPLLCGGAAALGGQG